MKIGRVIGTATVGLLFALFVAVDLVLFGVVALDSVVITALLAIGLVGGGVLGWLSAARRTSPASVAAVGGPPPPQSSAPQSSAPQSSAPPPPPPPPPPPM